MEKTANVIGIGVACYIDEGWYIPIEEWKNGALHSVWNKGVISDFLEEFFKILLKKNLIMHNGVFDIACIYHSYGVNLTEALYCDTILLKHTVDEERPFGLKDLAIKYQEEIGLPDDELANQEQLLLKEAVLKAGGKWTQKQKDMYLAPAKIIGTYCCADVDLTLRIFDYLEEILFDEGLDSFFYDDEVMPLYRNATIPMKLKGLFIDVEYFESLQKEVECDIIKLEKEVFDIISEDIEPKVKEILDSKINTTKSGKFAERVLQHTSLPVPLNKKTGKPTFAKNALQSLEADYPDHEVINWLLHDQNLKEDLIYKVKKELFIEKYPDQPYVFNLSSNKHLSWLLFDCYEEEPKSYSRKTGEAQVNKDSLDKYDLPFIPTLQKLKKQEKLLSTYILPILEKHIGGWLYPSMLQFGTTSGRYSCAGGLNLQTLPRDDTRIKRGFIAPPGYKVVNADFSSLEPRIFSWVSNDPGLKEVYLKDLDLYSKIAIDVFGLEGYSAKEGDPNFLKDKAPEWRSQSKVFSLATVYGASSFRIAEIMKISIEEAQDIINKYLDAYPNLRDYMEDREQEAKLLGYVKTKFGRVRHLFEAKELYEEYGDDLENKVTMAMHFAYDQVDYKTKLTGKQLYSKMTKEKKNASLYRQRLLTLGREGVDLYYKFRNYLNNAKNAPIQITAAHVTNAALVKLAKSFKDSKIDGWTCLTIHDEITTIVKDAQKELGAKLLKDAMVNNWVTEQIDIPMTTTPMIGNNFAETK